MEDIINVLEQFAPVFSSSVWPHAKILLIGAILCRKERTIASILRIMGLGNEPHFVNYHRVLSKARWSGLHAAKILLGLLVALVPVNLPIIIGVDDTIERRKGEKIKNKGCYRDPVRSTKKHVVRCFGLKWLCMMLIVSVPWSERHWSLPFLTVLTPSKKANAEENRRHKTTIDWTIQMIKQVSRWLPDRCIILIGDGSFACIRLAHTCIQLGKVALISRLRLDARLFDFPGPEVPGKRGPKSQKSERLPKLKELVDDPDQDWQEVHVKWYGGVMKSIRFLTGVCLWHTPGQKPAPIRWVLVIDPEGKCDPEAFFSTDTQLVATQIVEYFVLRWGVEVTFEESRRHLGVETQRQWTDKAIARSTPALMGLFSIVCLIALKLISKGKELIPQTTAWYEKPEVTFSDVLTFVRRHIWSSRYNFPMEFPTILGLSKEIQPMPQSTPWYQKQYITFPEGSTAIWRYSWDSEYVKSAHNTGYVLFPAHEWEAILDLLAAAA